MGFDLDGLKSNEFCRFPYLDNAIIPSSKMKPALDLVRMALINTMQLTQHVQVFLETIDMMIFDMFRPLMTHPLVRNLQNTNRRMLISMISSSIEEIQQQLLLQY